MSKSKTLCVGGSGFIGSYLMKEIEADNLDLVEGGDAREELPGGYETIIFLACNQGNTEKAYKDNWKMYERLNELRKNHTVAPYIIYVSSAAVYNLDNWYALSKQLGEAYAARFDRHTILRLSNVYGHGDGHGAPDRFMRGDKVIHGKGTQIRDLIPVEQVVTKILNLMDEIVGQFGTFNVSSGVGTTVNQMFELFGKGESIHQESWDYGVDKSILIPGRIYG